MIQSQRYRPLFFQLTKQNSVNNKSENDEKKRNRSRLYPKAKNEKLVLLYEKKKETENEWNKIYTREKEEAVSTIGTCSTGLELCVDFWAKSSASSCCIFCTTIDMPFCRNLFSVCVWLRLFSIRNTFDYFSFFCKRKQMQTKRVFSSFTVSAYSDETDFARPNYNWRRRPSVDALFHSVSLLLVIKEEREKKKRQKKIRGKTFKYCT